MKTWQLLFASTVIISLAACSKGEHDGSRVNPQDKAFIHSATLVNAAEIVLGQLAADSSETPAIKAFGEKMVAEHGSSMAELETLAGNLGMPTPDTLTTRHEQLRQLLLTKKGREFDSLYIHSQVPDHRNAIVLYENAHGIGTNSQVKDHARNMVPHLIQHYQEAQTLAQGY